MTKAKKKAKERERDALVDNHAKVISLLGRVLQKNVASSEDEDVVPPLEYASSEDEAETIARKGDRWDDAADLSALKVRLLCRSKSWVVDGKYIKLIKFRSGVGGGRFESDDSFKPARSARRANPESV